MSYQPLFQRPTMPGLSSKMSGTVATSPAQAPGSIGIPHWDQLTPEARDAAKRATPPPAYDPERLYYRDGSVFVKGGEGNSENGPSYWGTKEDRQLAPTDRINYTYSIPEGDSARTLTVPLHVSEFQSYEDFMPQREASEGSGFLPWGDKGMEDLYVSTPEGYAPSIYGATFGDESIVPNRTVSNQLSKTFKDLSNKNVISTLGRVAPYLKGNTVASIDEIPNTQGVLWKVKTDTGNEYVLSSQKHVDGGAFNIKANTLDPDFRHVDNAAYGSVAPLADVNYLPKVKFYEDEGDGFMSFIAPIALSFLAPGIGSALGSSLGVTSTLGQAALGGAVTGGLSSAFSGGSPLEGALLGGLGSYAGGAIGGSAFGKANPILGRAASGAVSNLIRSKGDPRAALAGGVAGGLGQYLGGYNGPTYTGALPQNMSWLANPMGNLAGQMASGRKVTPQSMLTALARGAAQGSTRPARPMIKGVK